MAVFSATFTASTVTVAEDTFALVAPSNSRIRLREIRLGQYTEFGDAAAEILSLQVIRGHRTAGNQTTLATKANISGHSGRLTDTGTLVAVNDTGQATDTGSGAQTLISDAWNIQVPWLYDPEPEENIIVEADQRLVVRLSAPADAMTLNGTIIYEKIGTLGSNYG